MLFAPDRPEKYATPRLTLHQCPECGHSYHGSKAYAFHLVNIHKFKAEDFTDGYGRKYINAEG
jgi:hypothetical protein